MFHSNDSSHWWGRHALPENQGGFWRIGPLHLWVQHRTKEWRVAWKHGKDGLDQQPGSEFGPDVPEDARILRFSTQNSWNELIFSPILADRAVVTKLTIPLYILPGDTATLYLSTALWLRIEGGQPSRFMHELPTYRPSDSWFGPNTTIGELCYSSLTPAFLSLREVPLRLHRVITAVMVRNLGDDPLFIERLNLPLPRLSLFYSPRSGFWTDMVTLERKEGSELANLRLERQPPPEASPTQFIAAPRIGTTESNLVVRAFSALFKDRKDVD